MAVVAVLLGLGGAWAITRAVETVNDRILGAASRAIADTLTVEEGEITLNLSPAIFGMLEDSERDNVYYSVRRAGIALTGYADLPDIAPHGLRDTEVVFGTARFRGAPVRVVAEGRRLPQISEPVVVEVAETMGARQRISSRLLYGLALLEALLIALTAILLPLAVRSGLLPLRRLSGDMDQRVASDLTPLPMDGVPRELGDLVRAFNDMLARLDTTLQGIRRFTADASHQMRTPLSILRTHVALLRRAAPGSAEAVESLGDIDQATERLQRLLTQLLALARADSVATADVVRVETDMAALAERVAAEHAPQAVREGIELYFDRADGPAAAQTHPMLASEVLSNLIDNAIRYNRRGGTVSVAVRLDTAAVLVWIEDEGPGIAPEDRTRVLTRFTRLARDAARPGSGLGLPIAAMLSTAIGARLTLATAASGGLRVEVAFPREERMLTAV